MTLAIQQRLFGSQIHSDELELLFKSATEYNWDIIEQKVEPKFRKAALEFHRTRKSSSNCPLNQQQKTESLPLFEIEVEKPQLSVSHNPKGAGCKPQPFIAFIKAFNLASVIYVEQNCSAIHLALRTNTDFFDICGFKYVPAERTLQDFDQIMAQYDLWEMVRDITYQQNVDNKIIIEEQEDTLNIDNTHQPAYSAPSKSIKECRECPSFKECVSKVSTDQTADWYVKSKCKIFYAHQIGLAQLSKSGAPVSRIVLNGKQYEPDSLEPLLKDIRDQRPNLKINKVVFDGIFNKEPSINMVHKYFPQAQVYTPVIANRGTKEIENPARGIKKITKHGNIHCIANNTLVFLSKDENLNAFILACPVYNSEARNKLIHLGIDVNKITCHLKEQCSPNSTQGRVFRLKKGLVPQINWELPQISYAHKIVYYLRTKIERLFGLMKKRYKMNYLYKRGIENVKAHIDKFMSLMHLIANVNGYYPV